MKKLEQVTSFVEKSLSTIRREPASISNKNKTSEKTNMQTNGEAWERGWHVDLGHGSASKEKRVLGIF